MKVGKSLFPYGMEEQNDGSWSFFNRDYTHIGKFKLNRFGATKQAALGAIDDSGGRRRIYFYDDATVPASSAANMTAYLEKIGIVFRLEYSNR